MDYTTLSLADVRHALCDVSRDTMATFGQLDERQLNWRPDAARWSIAQCFEHLFTANRLMLRSADAALRHEARSVWQRVPLLPRVFGQLMIRSQAPGGTRKYTAPEKARPTASDIPGDIIQRFVSQHGEAAAWMQTLEEPVAASTIMISPFVGFITYSVLDGSRLIVAHDRRHFEQARRVMQLPEFPTL